MEKLTGTLFILTLLFAILLIKGALIGAGVWFNASFPRAARRMGRAYARHGLRCFFIGIVNFVVVAVVSALSMEVPGANILGLALFGGLLSAIVFGLAITYRHTGGILRPGAADSPLSVLYGGLCAEALFLAPVIGQVVWLVAVFRGLGAVVTGWITGEAEVESASTPE